MPMSMNERIREVADPLIEGGALPTEVRETVFARTGIMIGKGGDGPYDAPLCPYCGSNGGGGHGGLCPGSDPFHLPPPVPVATSPGGLPVPMDALITYLRHNIGAPDRRFAAQLWDELDNRLSDGEPLPASWLPSLVPTIDQALTDGRIIFTGKAKLVNPDGH